MHIQINSKQIIHCRYVCMCVSLCGFFLPFVIAGWRIEWHWALRDSSWHVWKIYIRMIGTFHFKPFSNFRTVISRNMNCERVEYIQLCIENDKSHDQCWMCIYLRSILKSPFFGFPDGCSPSPQEQSTQPLLIIVCIDQSVNYASIHGRWAWCANCRCYLTL